MIMASKQVIKALKISNIKITDLIVGIKKTNKTVPITLNGKPMVFQTPFLEVRGDLRKTPLPNIHQLDTLFKGDTKQKIQQWYQFVEALESHISEQVINNGSKWFTQKNVIIKSLIREVETDKGVFFIKWLIDLQPGMFVDENKKLFDPTCLHDKDLVKLIVEISSLWIDEKQCGLAVIVQKVLVRPYAEKVQSEYIFNDSDSASESDEKASHIISLLATEQKKPAPKSQVPDTSKQPLLQNKFNQIHESSAIELVGDKKSAKENLKKNSNLSPPIKDDQREKKNKNYANNSNLVRDDLRERKIKNYDGRVIWNEHQTKRDTIPKNTPFATNKNTPQPTNKNTKSLPTKQASFRPVISDDSDNGDDVVSDKDENNRMKQLLEEYTSSDEMAEINEDDLDFED